MFSLKSMTKLEDLTVYNRTGPYLPLWLNPSSKFEQNNAVVMLKIFFWRHDSKEI